MRIVFNTGRKQFEIASKALNLQSAWDTTKEITFNFYSLIYL